MFNKEFEFGVATSSYQIEGSHCGETKIESIWDAFAKKEGAVADGSDGSRACEHLIKYKEDIALMKELGVDTYRFSISWPRIMPEEGKISKAGIDFYNNLLEELRENGIKASVTLYHWDLPQWIYERNGGWVSRETAFLFLEYAKLMFDTFDEYVENWVTINEPFCISYLGHLEGAHAPGHKNVKDYLHAAHTVNLAHGLAVKYYKSKYNKPIGFVVNLSPICTVDNSFINQIAVRMQDAVVNRMHLDPIFKGSYPMDYLMNFSHLVDDFGFIKEDDLELASQPIDFLGINYYTEECVQYDKESPTLVRRAMTDKRRTAMGWDISPEGLYEIVKRVRNDYTQIPIMITENGSAWDDTLEDGKVHDNERIDYLNSHLQTIVDLNNDDMNITGYYAWSFMDNFEWAYGYEKRFGIVYVEYETQKRYPKDSYFRYKEIVNSRKL